MKRSQRGFTLIELAMLIAVLALLLAIGLPFLRAMQDRNTINAAADQLKGELQFAQGEAKAYGVPIEDNLKNNPVAGEANDVTTAAGYVVGRIRQRPALGQPPQTLKFFKLGPRDVIALDFENIPLIEMDAEPQLTGTVLELGTTPGEELSDGTFTTAATLAFDANGELLLNDSSQLGLINLGNIPNHYYIIDVDQLGKVTLKKGG